MAGLACGEPNTISFDILKIIHPSLFQHQIGFLKRNAYVGRAIKRDPQVVSGESGAVAMGLVATVMQDPDYQELREALQLDETSNVLMFSTEGTLIQTIIKNFMEVKGMDFNAVNAAAEGYREDMVKF